MKKILLIILAGGLFGFAAFHKTDKFVIERKEVDGLYFYNVTYKDSVYNGLDSDQLMNLLCPNCYEITNND